MAGEIRKVRMRVSRGNPTDGAVIRAGAIIELPVFWADKFIADGTAEEIKAVAEPKTKGKSKK